MTKRVLLAEDEPNIQASLTFVLERAGFEVSSEADGMAVCDSVLSDPPDAMILDVMLPGLDGMEILRRIRADGRSRDLPVIILTAKGQREDREAALGGGADAFISKPFSNASVVEAVRRLTDAAGR